MIRVCFHGAESTGKSTLSKKLSAEYGWPRVPEYGRTWAIEHGTEFTMADLLAIARGQDAAMQSAAAAEPAPDLLLLDTDPLMTAAWAQMLFGEAPEPLFGYAKADLYLLFAADVPWIPDGTRFFGAEHDRSRFAALAEDVLHRARLPFVRVAGGWDEREATVRAAIGRLLGHR